MPEQNKDQTINNEMMAKMLPKDSNEQQPEYANYAMSKMPAYIGTKIVCAMPMDECTFLKTYKKQDVSDRETRQGYVVVYEDDYTSWSPKETFERAYRLITKSERQMM